MELSINKGKNEFDLQKWTYSNVYLNVWLILDKIIYKTFIFVANYIYLILRKPLKENEPLKLLAV